MTYQEFYAMHDKLYALATEKAKQGLERGEYVTDVWFNPDNAEVQIKDRDGDYLRIVTISLEELQICLNN